LLKIAAIISHKTINCFYQHQLVFDDANGIQKTKNHSLLKMSRETNKKGVLKICKITTETRKFLAFSII